MMVMRPVHLGDNDFDIDVRDIANSIAMKDDIINVLNSYAFDLNVITVNPGYYYSDHGSFWDNGYTGLLLGESWETNDQSPFYHTSNDRVSTLDLDYFHELTKLTAAYMATKGGLLAVDNTVTGSPTMLTANQGSATYQWIDCNTDSSISGATSQTYMPIANGNYAVDVTLGSCTERSACIMFNTLGLEAFLESDISVFPNPVSSVLNIETHIDVQDLDIDLYDVAGKQVLQTSTSKVLTRLDIENIPQGIYFLNLKSSGKNRTYKIIKE